MTIRTALFFNRDGTPNAQFAIFPVFCRFRVIQVFDRDFAAEFAFARLNFQDSASQFAPGSFPIVRTVNWCERIGRNFSG